MEQRIAEKEVGEAGNDGDENNTEKRKVEEETDKHHDEEEGSMIEKELLEKKRKINRESREIEQKLREIKEKKNIEEKRKKEAAALLRYRKYPENQAISLMKEMEKRLAEARTAAKQAFMHASAMETMVGLARQHVHLLTCRRVALEQMDDKIEKPETKL
ncbi:uncharacterized protein LOC130701637 [Daphnia carinata]|uniref:uncharacterized protein LOC130701637 n=1 Tax=Daphnia carinata TaxID=120202 RepID=UPI00257F0E45|nr:uncharacterized protein LOC130701637 [Daphnia carinata]